KVNLNQLSQRFARGTFGGVLLCVAASVFAEKPSITNQPASQSVAVGSHAIFCVSASGSQPLTYQWRFNGAPISAATNTTFTIMNVGTNDAGPYSVVVANHAGSVVSSNAILGVGYAAAIVEQPVSQAIAPGSNATFTVSASGTSRLVYRWQFNGSDIPGETNAILTITDVQPTEAGIYVVIVTNDYGSVTSFPAPLPAVGQEIVINFESLPPTPGINVVSVCDFYREKGFVLSPLVLST